MPPLQGGGIGVQIPPDGLHPFPAPGGSPAQEGVIVLHGVFEAPVYLRTAVFQGEDAAVGVRRRDGEGQLLRFRFHFRGVCLRPLDEEDIPAASAALPIAPVPGGNEGVCIRAGIGGETAVPQVKGSDPQGGKGKETDPVRRRPVEGKAYLAVGMEDGKTQTKPVRFPVIIGRSEARSLVGDLFPLRGPVGPIGGIQNGLCLLLPGGQSELRRAVGVGRLRRRGGLRRDRLTAGGEQEQDKNREKQKRFFHLRRLLPASTLQFNVASKSRGFFKFPEKSAQDEA